MTADREQWAESLTAGHQGGWLTSFLADETPFDRRAKWRLASWAVGAVSALTIAILASQNAASLHREQSASADLLDRQAEQIQSVAQETQTESKRLSAAITTLNTDRDRLFARVTSVEQGLESVTGSVKRQGSSSAAAALPSIPSDPPANSSKAAPSVHVTASPAPPTPAPAASAPPTGPIASTLPIEPPPPKPMPPVGAPLFEAPVPLMASKSMMAPPESSPGKFNDTFAAHPVAAVPVPVISTAPEKMASIEPPSAKPEPQPPSPAKPDVASIPVPRTEFGVDLGGANSVEGLRALWRGLTASNKALADLRPIITIKERTGGYGMQLRLVAGPLNDAAAAAKLCAGLKLGERTCETSVFDGQRLALKNEPVPKQPAAREPMPKAEAAQKPASPVVAKPASVRRRTSYRQEPKREPVAEQVAVKPAEPAPPPPPPPKPSGLSSMLGIGQ